MADQPSDGRENFEPANEINEESFLSADGYGEEPERRRSLASHHRSHRHHSSSGSYSSSDSGYGRSSGGYSDGYSAGYEAGYRSSHSRHHSSRYSDGYDDGYESGYSSHHSSHHSSRSSSHYSSSSDRSSKPGRLASHHRSRHHHHHHYTESGQTDQNYVSSMETVPIETGRGRIGTEVEAVEIPLTLDDMKNLPYDDQAVRLEDVRYADRGQRPEDVYYADSGRDQGRRNDSGQEIGRAPGPLASTIVAASAINPPKTHDASAIESSGSRRRRKKQQKRQTILGILAKILIFFIVLIIAAIGGLIFLRIRGEQSMTHKAEEVVLTMEHENTPEEVEEIEDDGKTITYKGEKYRWNDDISTILFLGSDRTVEQQQERESVIGINGQADTILLGVIDNKNKKISFININRDTMTSVGQYTPDGDYAGDKQMQICLAYSYGKDNEDGCKMMAAAVSNFLYGIPIDSYARISYDAVPMLNDSVGGVTVKVTEDMTSTDPAFVKDANVTLTGSQALRYIRWRNHEVTETNELRMARQKQYFYAFMNKTIEATRADLTLPLGLYNNAKPYMTTDITPSRVTYLTSKVLEYGVSGEAIHSVAGSSIDGASGLVEFHADDVKLYEMILNTFYNKVK